MWEIPGVYTWKTFLSRKWSKAGMDCPDDGKESQLLEILKT